jgi:putative SOS response-associated peptidase YedK
VCGRYALYGPRRRSREEREFFESLDSFPLRYNVAPTDVMPIAILKEGRPVLVPARWGLVTPQSKDRVSIARSSRAIARGCEPGPFVCVIRRPPASHAGTRRSYIAPKRVQR